MILATPHLRLRLMMSVLSETILCAIIYVKYYLTILANFFVLLILALFLAAYNWIKSKLVQFYLCNTSEANRQVYEYEPVYLEIK